MLKQLSSLLFFLWRKQLLLAFEYGVVLSQVAQKMGVEVTPEMIKRAEEMVEGEFKSQSLTHLAGHMEINIMTAFEIDTTK